MYTIGPNTVRRVPLTLITASSNVACNAVLAGNSAFKTTNGYYDITRHIIKNLMTVE